MGVSLGSQEAAKIVIAQGRGGNMINTCSISSRSASASFSAYAATKFAVLALVQSSAKSLAQNTGSPSTDSHPESWTP